MASAINDVIQSAQLILYVSKVDELEFYANVQLQDSVIRRLTIIGEAAGRLSDETREAIPDIEWHKFKGMRNRLIHKYDEIDIDLVWDITQQELSVLIQAIRTY
ncbi:MAG: HepT-like ribonuclease domain-containing protein [Cyanobacteria bacterium J06632_22]